MKKTKWFFVLLLLLMVAAGCAQQKVNFVYRIYNVDDVTHVLDSIKDSGTVISPFQNMGYRNDEGKNVVAKMASLYRNGESCGSVKIEEVAGKKNIQIIDQIREAKK